ncbi:MAG: Hsp70 family protein, partial [Burkholderiaceae bacterium]|nr:Hsp70 family protein [Burkholderiaceae bacterium]
QAETMINSVKKSVAEHGDKLDEAEKSSIDEAVTALEEALKGDDKDDIEAKTNVLMTASQKLGEKMYADMQSQQAEGAPEAGSQANDDDIVDAEVKEVKKD